MTYYNVGKLLIGAQGGVEKTKYGDSLIKEYSKKLTKELNKSYNITLLKNIRQFYLITQKSPTLSDQLTWSHYVEIIRVKDIKFINYYIKITEEQNLSVRELRKKINNQEYERLDEDTKNKLISNNKKNEIEDFIKHPIIIQNKYHHEEISEKI